MHGRELSSARAPGRSTHVQQSSPDSLGFRHRDDVLEVRKLLERLGIEVRIVAPSGAAAADIRRLGEADFNVVLYPETGLQAAQWLQRTFGQPFTRTVPIGLGATRAFVEEVATLAGLDAAPLLAEASRADWYARSVDSTYLTGKRVFVFGECHARGCSGAHGHA